MNQRIVIVFKEHLHNAGNVGDIEVERDKKIDKI